MGAQGARVSGVVRALAHRLQRVLSSALGVPQVMMRPLSRAAELEGSCGWRGRRAWWTANATLGQPRVAT